MVDTTWTNGGGDGKASTAANWSNGIDVGYNVTFDGTSTANCTFDYDGELGTFTIAAGYTGTITQSSDMYISGYSQVAGTLTRSGTPRIYCNGDFLKNGGTFSVSPMLVTLKDGASLTIDQSGINLFIYSNVTITNVGAQDLQCQGCYVALGKTLTITEGKMLYVRQYSGYYSLENHGSIQGGTLKITIYNADYTITKIGNVSSALIIHLHSASLTSRKLILNQDEIGISSTISIVSDHATYTCTLNLNGHSLTATTITVGTRGVLANSAATDSVIACNNFDSSAGTFTEANTQVILNGNGTLKTAAGHKFDELVQRDNVITTLGSNITVTNEFDTAGSFVQGAYSITHENPEKRLIAPMVNPIIRNPKRSPFLNNRFTKNIEIEVV